MTRAWCVAVVFAIAGCNGEAPRAGDSDRAARAPAIDPQPRAVDCAAYWDHVEALTASEVPKARSADTKRMTEQALAMLKSRRAKLEAGCEQEAAASRISTALFDCVMAARTMAELSRCDARGGAQPSARTP